MCLFGNKRPSGRDHEKDTVGASAAEQFNVKSKTDEKNRVRFRTSLPARYRVLHCFFIFWWSISEVFTDVKAKLMRSEVCTGVQVKQGAKTRILKHRLRKIGGEFDSAQGLTKTKRTPFGVLFVLVSQFERKTNNFTLFYLVAFSVF